MFATVCKSKELAVYAMCVLEKQNVGNDEISGVSLQDCSEVKHSTLPKIKSQSELDDAADNGGRVGFLSWFGFGSASHARSYLTSGLCKGLPTGSFLPTHSYETQ